MGESVDVPQTVDFLFDWALEREMTEQTRWGIFYRWHKEDEPDEWLCDHQGTVFVFGFRDEAEALRVMLDPGDGVDIEVKPYDGDGPVRAYPWPGEESLAVRAKLGA